MTVFIHPLLYRSVHSPSPVQQCSFTLTYVAVFIHPHLYSSVHSPSPVQQCSFILTYTAVFIHPHLYSSVHSPSLPFSQQPTRTHLWRAAWTPWDERPDTPPEERSRERRSSGRRWRCHSGQTPPPCSSSPSAPRRCPRTGKPARSWRWAAPTAGERPLTEKGRSCVGFRPCWLRWAESEIKVFKQKNILTLSVATANKILSLSFLLVLCFCLHGG